MNISRLLFRWPMSRGTSMANWRVDPCTIFPTSMSKTNFRFQLRSPRIFFSFPTPLVSLRGIFQVPICVNSGNVRSIVLNFFNGPSFIRAMCVNLHSFSYLTSNNFLGRSNKVIEVLSPSFFTKEVRGLLNPLCLALPCNPLMYLMFE